MQVTPALGRRLSVFDFAREEARQCSSRIVEACLLVLPPQQKCSNPARQKKGK